MEDCVIIPLSDPNNPDYEQIRNILLKNWDEFPINEGISFYFSIANTFSHTFNLICYNNNKDYPEIQIYSKGDTFFRGIIPSAFQVIHIDNKNIEILIYKIIYPSVLPFFGDGNYHYKFTGILEDWPINIEYGYGNSLPIYTEYSLEFKLISKFIKVK